MAYNPHAGDGMSDEPAASISNVSGGINLNGDANIGGDVVGRDKVTSVGRDYIQGDQIVYAASLLRATPPAPPAHFTGREADLAKFTQLLTSGASVAITALHGMGGIGKTSLAQKLAERSRDRFSRRRVVVDARPQPRCDHRARCVGAPRRSPRRSFFPAHGAGPRRSGACDVGATRQVVRHDRRCVGRGVVPVLQAPYRPAARLLITTRDSRSRQVACAAAWNASTR